MEPADKRVHETECEKEGSCLRRSPTESYSSHLESLKLAQRGAEEDFTMERKSENKKGEKSG